MAPLLTTGAGKFPVIGGGGGGGYLLDQITTQPKFAFSTRKIRSAYSGNCMRVANNAVDATQDIGFSSDEIDQAAIDTFHTGSGGGSATNGRILYDQSGNGNDVGLGIGSNTLMRLSVYNSGAQAVANGHTAVGFNSTNNRGKMSSSTLFLSDVITSSAFTIIVSGYFEGVVSAVPAVDAAAAMSDGPTGYFSGGYFGDIGAGAIRFRSYLYDGGNKVITMNASVATKYVGIHRLGGGTQEIWLNGGSAGASGVCGNIAVMNYQKIAIAPGAGLYSDFNMLDLLVYNTALSAADINTLCNGAGITLGSVASRAGVSWTTLT